MLVFICDSLDLRTGEPPRCSPGRASVRQDGPSGWRKHSARQAVGSSCGSSTSSNSRHASAALFHQYLRERNPDLIVVTPLVVLKTAQLDLARAAIELGFRNVFAAASWDHLSSKGELNFSPQQAIVWNDVQKREAIELHHLDAGRIAVTGAQVFDEWFDRDAIKHTGGLLRARGSPCGQAHTAVCLFVAARGKPCGACRSSSDGFSTCAKAGMRFSGTAEF